MSARSTGFWTFETPWLISTPVFGVPSPSLQIGFHERLQIAVQNAIDVADFDFRASILNQPIRLKHVRTDLTAKGNVHLAVFDGLRVGLLLIHLDFEQTRSQDLHADIPVFMLRPLVLALHDDT